MRSGGTESHKTTGGSVVGSIQTAQPLPDGVGQRPVENRATVQNEMHRHECQAGQIPDEPGDTPPTVPRLLQPER